MRRAIFSAILLTLASPVLGATFLRAQPAQATEATSSTIIQTVADQATVDIDFTRSGLQLQINASLITETSVTGTVVKTSGAIANISDLTCDEFGCQSINVGDCVPEGNSPGDATLPPDALHFGPGPGAAALAATFTCTRPFVGETFLLIVDVTWSGHVSFATGGPSLVGGTSFSIAPASVAGTASDGTTEFITPETHGILIHSMSTSVVLP